MPRLAFAQSFWDGYDMLEKPVRAGVRKAMRKFQTLSAAELNADKGLHLESVGSARDPRMRTIRITDFWRGVVLAPDDGSDMFLLVNVLPHDDAYSWAAKRLYSANSATRALEVRNAVALDELTPLYETAARNAPQLLFAGVSDGTLHELGIDDQVLRAARSLVDKAQLDAFATLLPEDQLEVLQYLAEGFGPDEVYRDVVAVRRPADAPAEPVEDLATVIANTSARIRLVTGPDELEEMLEKPFDAWRVFLHPSQRRVAYRTSYRGPVQVTGGPGTGKTVAALHRVKHLLGRREDGRVLLTTYTNALAAGLRQMLGLLLDEDEELPGAGGRDDGRRLRERHRAREVRIAPKPVGDREQRQLWEKAVKQLDLPFTSQFLAQEYRHVVLGQDLRDLDAYLGASRRGAAPASAPHAGVRCGAPWSGSNSSCVLVVRPHTWVSAPGRRNSCPKMRLLTPMWSSTRLRICTPRSGGCCVPQSPPARTTCSSRVTRISGSTIPGSRSALWVSRPSAAASGCGSTTARRRRSLPGRRGSSHRSPSKRSRARGGLAGRIPVPAARAPAPGTGVRDATGGDRGSGGPGPHVGRRWPRAARDRRVCPLQPLWTQPRRS